MSREENLIKNTVIIAIGTLFPKFTTIITLPILTAYMSKVDYGMNDIIITVSNLLLPMATLKIEAGAFRFIVDKHKDKRECSKIIMTIFIFIFFISTFVLGIYYLIPHKIEKNITFLCCIYFFLQSLYSMLQQIIRGLSKNILYSISTISYTLFNLIFIVIFIKHAKLGLVGILYSNNIALIISIIFIIIAGKIYKYFDLNNFSIDILKELLAYSWPMVPNSLSLWILNLSDRFMISTFLGSEANADYAVANKIPNLYSTMEGTFVLAWQENASLANRDKDSNIYYSKIFNGIFELLVLLIAGVMTICPVIYSLLIQGDYSSAYIQIPILFLAMFFSSISSFFGGIYVAEKATKRVAITSFIAALINISINFLFIRQIGLFAASLSTLLSYFFLAAFRIFDINLAKKINYNFKKKIIGILILILMCIIMSFNTIILNIINLIVFITICCTYSNSVFKNFILLFKKKIM